MMSLFYNIVIWLFLLSTTFLCVSAARAQDALLEAISKSSAGMDIQSKRMEIVAENLANAETLASTPGGHPYQRKILFLDNRYDKKSGTTRVHIKKISVDRAPYIPKYDPYHPLANDQGYVLFPNVNRLIENMDSKEAELQYQANLNALDAARSMRRMSLDLLQQK